MYHYQLRAWLDDADLSGVRGLKGLDTLPPEERQSWTKLWSDARDLLGRVTAK